MEAKNLRPLNYFQNKEGKIYQLKKLSFEEDGEDFALVYGDELEGEYFWKDECSGVCITEDWLRKFGFTIGASETFSAYYHKKIGIHNLCLRFMRGEVNCVYFCLGNEQNSSYKPKYYVHELQNLYYFLCGEELI